MCVETAEQRVSGPPIGLGLPPDAAQPAKDAARRCWMLCGASQRHPSSADVGSLRYRIRQRVNDSAERELDHEPRLVSRASSGVGRVPVRDEDCAGRSSQRNRAIVVGLLDLILELGRRDDMRTLGLARGLWVIAHVGVPRVVVPWPTQR